MAHFSSSLFAQVVYKNEALIKFWAEQTQEITERNKEGKRPIDVGAVYMGYRLNTAKTGAAARGILYAKGAYILHMLRMLMWDPQSGDSRFNGMLQDFVKSYYNREASTEDFKQVVEKHMIPAIDMDGNGRLDWFFNQWVYGTSLPEYHLDARVENAEKGQFNLLFKISQNNVDDSFKMRVPIYADLGGKTIRLASIAVRGNGVTKEFSLLLPKKPEQIRLCAMKDVLCTFK
jgi:hypothetical protein